MHTAYNKYICIIRIYFQEWDYILSTYIRINGISTSYQQTQRTNYCYYTNQYVGHDCGRNARRIRNVVNFRPEAPKLRRNYSDVVLFIDVVVTVLGVFSSNQNRIEFEVTKKKTGPREIPFNHHNFSCLSSLCRYVSIQTDLAMAGKLSRTKLIEK